MVAATHAGIAPALVLNKTDLDPSGELIKAASIYADYGYPFVAVSAETGEGIDALRTICAGKINSLVGHSGVGKTSLLKVLIPGTDRPVAAIHAATNQGRHTTTAAELFPLPHGGDLIDSPGIRQFMPSGLTPPEVAHHFPGFEPFMGQCKFRDCLHLTEPGCGIREGLEAGQIDADRYASYQRILASVQVDDKPEWMKKGS
jgi:ribosome biogenesis GTPase